ncbi:MULTISPECIES: hypothetical protein [Marinilactibacillus]|nr:hypothetical protein [Marinilactibacillus sp. 15R]
MRRAIERANIVFDPKQLKRVREFILEADSSITPELAFSSI